MRRRKISWSDLPSELLSAVAGRLETRLDVRKFRAVCSAWRQSTTLSVIPKENLLSSLLPHKISTPTPPLLDKNRSSRVSFEIDGRFIMLVQSSVFLLRSSKYPELPPWLITVEESNPGKFYLRKPLSRVNFEELPENFPTNLNLSDIDVKEIGRFCTLRLADNPIDMFERKTWRYCRNRVILFVNPKCRKPPTIDDCTAMVLYDNGTLSAIRLSNEEEKHLNPKGRKFDDIVEFNGMIYAVDRRGRAYKIDYNLLSVQEVVDEALSDGSRDDKKKRLVVLNGELYMVYRIRERYEDINFEVYRLIEHEEEDEWELVKDICDVRILFVTYDGCFFAWTKDFPGWRGNSIVMYKNTFPQYGGDSVYGGPASLDINIFRGKYYDDKLDIIVFHFEDEHGFGGFAKPATSDPRYADVFWPPPAWLSPTTELNTCISEEDKDSEEDEESEDDLELQRCSNDPITAPPVPPSLQVQTSSTPLQPVDNNQTVQVDTTPTKDIHNGAPKEIFQRIYVNPHLVPTLKKVWYKYGNIIQQHVAQNNGHLAWGLESLANVVKLLQSDSGMCLNDVQAAYLNSTVYLLLGMGFKLNWLFPFTQKALATYDRQQQLHYVKGLKVKRSNLVAQLHDLESRFSKHRKLAYDAVIASPPVDLKNVLS